MKFHKSRINWKNMVMLMLFISIMRTNGSVLESNAVSRITATLWPEIKTLSVTDPIILTFNWRRTNSSIPLPLEDTESPTKWDMPLAQMEIRLRGPDGIDQILVAGPLLVNGSSRYAHEVITPTFSRPNGTVELRKDSVLFVLRNPHTYAFSWRNGTQARLELPGKYSITLSGRLFLKETNGPPESFSTPEVIITRASTDDRFIPWHLLPSIAVSNLVERYGTGIVTQVGNTWEGMDTNRGVNIVVPLYSIPQQLWPHGARMSERARLSCLFIISPKGTIITNTTVFRDWID